MRQEEWPSSTGLGIYPFVGGAPVLHFVVGVAELEVVEDAIEGVVEGVRELVVVSLECSQHVAVAGWIEEETDSGVLDCREETVEILVLEVNAKAVGGEGVEEVLCAC